MTVTVLDALSRGVAIGALVALAVAFWRGGAGHPRESFPWEWPS